MVNVCIVPGCNNCIETEITSNIRCHKFPLNDKTLVNKWVKAIGRNNWEPSIYSSICSVHFLPDDYINNKLHKLKYDAVPSINLPIMCYHSDEMEIKDNDQNFEYIIEDEHSISMENSTINITKKFDQINMTYAHECKEQYNNQHNTHCLSVGTQTVNTDGQGSDINKLKKRIKQLQRTIQRRDKRVTELEKRIQELKNYQMDIDSPTLLPEFEMEECLLRAKDNSNSLYGRRYSEKRKRFALTLHFHFPKAYKFVAQHLALPNERTIRRLMSTYKNQPEMLSKLLLFQSKDETTKSIEKEHLYSKRTDILLTDVTNKGDDDDNDNNKIIQTNNNCNVDDRKEHSNNDLVINNNNNKCNDLSPEYIQAICEIIENEHLYVKCIDTNTLEVNQSIEKDHLYCRRSDSPPALVPNQDIEFEHLYSKTPN